MHVTTKVKIDITMPIINAPLNSKNAGTHRQARIPARNIGSNTYIYKAFIKSPSKNSKRFFILSPLSFICNSYDII